MVRNFVELILRIQNDLIPGFTFSLSPFYSVLSIGTNIVNFSFANKYAMRPMSFKLLTHLNHSFHVFLLCQTLPLFLFSSSSQHDKIEKIWLVIVSLGFESGTAGG